MRVCVWVGGGGGGGGGGEVYLLFASTLLTMYVRVELKWKPTMNFCKCIW